MAHSKSDSGRVYEQKFSVAFDYPVYFTSHSLDRANDTLIRAIDRKGGVDPHRVLVYVDSGVADAFPELCSDIESYFTAHSEVATLQALPIIVRGGEGAKNGWDPVREVMEALGRHHMCRHSVVIVVGGGGILDMVGFAVSLVHRGLRLVRLPTTVLGQNDSGVGVKNAMNEHGMKNFVGTFAPPFAVINDSAFLEKLPDREWVGGIAEAFKVAVIKDCDFFDFLCAHASRLRARDMAAMEELVRRCAILHLEHIRTSGDPFELGSSRPLDFGHWSAHRLESMSQFRIGHGQAVAIGVALDSFCGMRQGLLTSAELDRILQGLTDSGLPVYHELLGRQNRGGSLEIMEGLEQFREHLGGRLTLAMPDGLGRKRDVNRMDPAWVAEGISHLKTWSGAHPL